MVEKIVDALRGEFEEFTFTVEKDEEKQTTTITAEKNLTSGFDIDVSHETNQMVISHSSKIKTWSYFVVLGLVLLLTFLFGGSILDAFGLVSEGGRTMRLLYIIPVFIFLIPLFLVSSLVLSKISPRDEGLLERVNSILKELGYEAAIG